MWKDERVRSTFSQWPAWWMAEDWARALGVGVGGLRPQVVVAGLVDGHGAMSLAERDIYVFNG